MGAGMRLAAAVQEAVGAQLVVDALGVPLVTGEQLLASVQPAADLREFNIIRNPQGKNKDNYNDRWPFLFNAVIDSLDLRELQLSNRSFTWANALENPTYETLDRILVSTEWEAKFPLSIVQAMNRDILDLTPLFPDTRQAIKSNKQPLFKFELGWLLREGFHDMVEEVWRNEKKGRTPLQKWQFKIQRVCQFLRGWAKNTRGS